VLEAVELHVDMGLAPPPRRFSSFRYALEDFTCNISEVALEAEPLIPVLVAGEAGASFQVLLLPPRPPLL
jgi:hypothetical protein